MIGETYETTSTQNKTRFLFESVGNKGIITKAVLFHKMGLTRYNFGFGDLKRIGSEEVDDKVISNNGDFVKVLSTVAKCAFQFLEIHPGALLEIKPVDPPRNRLYHAILVRHYDFIEQNFDIRGIIGEVAEPFQADKEYESFELKHRPGKIQASK